jgi:surface antigen
MSTIKNSLLVAAGAAATLAGTQLNASADQTVSVKSGDTLYNIASQTGSTVDDIVSANNLTNPNLIFVGQNLTIPTSDAASQAPASDAGASTQTSYTVVAGDSLWGIATSHNMALAELLALNTNITTDTIIHPGDVLVVASSDYANGNSVSSSAVADNADLANQVTSSNVSSENTYPFGQCTWYVKDQVSWVGNWWGNAVDWKTSALNAGRTVNTTPTVGSVAYFAPGVQGVRTQYGHVAVVDSVNADGTITISEANYAGLLYHQRTITTDGMLFIH